MKNKEEMLELIEVLKATSQFIGDTRANLCAPYGLSPIQGIIVLDVYHHPSATKITDICKRLNKTTNTISPLVNRLVDRGLLYKRQSQKDNRVFEVFLSNSGHAMMNEFNKELLSFASPIFNRLTDEEFGSLFVSLKALNKVCGLE